MSDSPLGFPKFVPAEDRFNGSRQLTMQSLNTETLRFLIPLFNPVSGYTQHTIKVFQEFFQFRSVCCLMVHFNGSRMGVTGQKLHSTPFNTNNTPRI